MAWLLGPESLSLRLAAGVSILAILAWVDWRRNRERATRWREYAFLVLCVAAALAYGILNDQATTTISWEYFAYGKGVAERLPANEPPNSIAFRLEAARIGVQATWSAGLIIGVPMLVANNPSRQWPRLSYGRLAARLLLVLGCAVACAMALGIAGYFGAFTPWSKDFSEMVRLDQWRPRRFMAVFGIHLGGYIGALAGTALAVWSIRRARYFAGSCVP